MSKNQLFILIIVIILIILGVEIALRQQGGATSAGANLPSQTQINAVNDCVELCQTVYDESGTGENSSKEQVCENACNNAAGMSTSTNSNSH